MIALPSVAAVELTYRCNHRCLFCSCPWESDVIARGEELSTEQWIQGLREIQRRGTTIVSFTGGEATLRPDLLELIDAAIFLDLHPCLISNGRLLDENMLQALHARNVSLSISVPGIETFEQQTGHDGVEHVMSLFRAARDLDMQVTANIAVTKVNLPELYETIAYSLINGASYVLLNRFLPGGRGLDNSKYLLDCNEINQMLETAEEVLSKAVRKGHIGTELPYCIVNKPDSFNALGVAYQCGAAKSFYAIDPSGYVRVCNHSEQRLCSIFELDKLEQDPYWNRFTNRNYQPAMCANCEHTAIRDGGCREAAHVYGGNVCGADPCLQTA